MYELIIDTNQSAVRYIFKMYSGHGKYGNFL